MSHTILTNSAMPIVLISGVKPSDESMWIELPHVSLSARSSSSWRYPCCDYKFFPSRHTTFRYYYKPINVSSVKNN